ncbi:MAG: helix-turn-helix domain-containing protein [Ruminococcus sp.]|nr:helix-turn-helix domain-containing protein [Ruminococcus sp.]
MYERIRALREDADLTQTQIAKVLHCSQRVYSNYERGELDIPTEILIGLAEYYRTNVDYLLGLTPNKLYYKEI